MSHLQRPARPATHATTMASPLLSHPNSLEHEHGGAVLVQDELLTAPASQLHPVWMPDLMTTSASWQAHGTFTVTNDITPYTRAALFSKVGQQTPILARFSRTTPELPEAHELPHPLGFAVRFQTTDGDWDVVGLNTPVFFIRDPHKFPALLRTRQSPTGSFDAQRAWAFWSQTPESLHQLTILMSDLGQPASSRFMDGHAGHTYSFWNAQRERFWVKFHFKHQQGHVPAGQQATPTRFGRPDFQADLHAAIERGEHPAWTLHIQVMPEAEAARAPHDPFDLTKTWSETEHPLIEVGIICLNQLPSPHPAPRNTAPLSPAHLVPGIGHSPDPMLQARIFSCTDTMPHAADLQPALSATSRANEPTALEHQASSPRAQAEEEVRQAGALFRRFDAAHQARLATNIARSLRNASAQSLERQLALFDLADPRYGQRVREALAED